MQFAAIPGYAPVKERLVHLAKAQQIPHAQLFAGPEGSAALPLALAFATYVHCKDKQPTDACGQCSACTKMQKWVHPDVQFIFPTSLTQQVKGKDVMSNSFLKPWRTFLREQPYGNASNWSYHLGVENK
ncbi:MAG: DNA polymerase III subunit delta, partial [Bacteroidota bacterium]